MKSERGKMIQILYIEVIDSDVVYCSLDLRKIWGIAERANEVHFSSEM